LAQVLLKSYALWLVGGELFALDGCKLPSHAAKEWSGTLEASGKKKKKLETLRGKLVEQHIQLDKQAAQEQDLYGAAYSYGYDKDYQQRHLERVEQKLGSINTFLDTAEERKGASGDEVQWSSFGNTSFLLIWFLPLPVRRIWTPQAPVSTVCPPSHRP
jgi:hypothetical protein